MAVGGRQGLEVTVVGQLRSSLKSFVRPVFLHDRDGELASAKFFPLHGIN